MTSDRRPSNSGWKRGLIRWSSVFALFAIAGGGGAFATSKFLFKHPHIHAATSNQETTQSHDTEQNIQRETVLLIGTDARPKEPLGNSDVLCVASIDRKGKRIELLSIPRDTQVAFPDGMYHKINDALAKGGPEFTTKIVENLIGLPIDHYAVTRFDGLVKVINRIGGVPIDVPKRMSYRTGDKVYGVIDLKPGKQTLSGEQALGFVRFRHDALGDIGRTERQQSFLEALKSQLLRAENIPKLPGIVMDIANSIDTDMSVLDVTKLATHAAEYKSYQTIHETLPGSFHDPSRMDPNDLSYWVVNPKQARYVAQKFFEEGQVQLNPVQDPSVTQHWSSTNEKLVEDKTKAP